LFIVTVNLIYCLVTFDRGDPPTRPVARIFFEGQKVQNLSRLMLIYQIQTQKTTIPC